METIQQLKDEKLNDSVLWDGFHSTQEQEAELFNKALASIEAQETRQILNTDINPSLMESVQNALYSSLRGEEESCIFCGINSKEAVYIQGQGILKGSCIDCDNRGLTMESV